MSDFKSLHPIKLLSKYAMPNMVSAIFFSIYFIVDSIFVGFFLGKDALASMALVMPFIIISFGLSDMIAIGSSVQISMLLGKAKHLKANNIFSASICIIIVISSIMAFIGYFLVPLALDIFNTNENIKSMSLEYLNIFCYFYPFVAIPFAIDSYLRICGKNIYSMANNIIISITNIVLDYLFIVELSLGLAGAALATCIGFTLGAIIGLYPFLTNKLTLKFTKFYISLASFQNIILNGSSEFLSNISSQALAILVNYIILKISTIEYVAIFSIISYIDTFIMSAIISIYDSMQPSFSYNYATKNKARLKWIAKYTMILAFLVSLIAFIIVTIFGEEIFSVFIKKGEEFLIPLGVSALLIFSFNFLVAWFNLFIGSYLTACNEVKKSLAISLLNNLISPFIVLLILSQLLGINGVLITSFVAEILVMLISIRILKNSFKLSEQSH
ncbi:MULTISPECIES: MATE family efflux transporter [Helicobacter]|uniref:MATE family efflux transporter n=1 Tax=Helicobacter ibis TaxID=2962633 RepID=A0ABT4VDL4_9HELI|nr:MULTISPECIES: MATE family efflux transporter [Helicobacter]MDA3966592.1 MATE family efflux transporter [Helicobacter sp. WB40]MDA3968792.1 MATE family efflux transporter [Helicobacter ibis]